MFRAIGTVIVLYALSQFFNQTFLAFESTAVAVLGTVETAANVSTEQLEKVAQIE